MNLSPAEVSSSVRKAISALFAFVAGSAIILFLLIYHYRAILEYDYIGKLKVEYGSPSTLVVSGTAEKLTYV